MEIVVQNFNIDKFYISVQNFMLDLNLDEIKKKPH